MKMNRREFIGLCASISVLGLTGITGRINSAIATPEELDSSYPFYCPELIEITEKGPIIQIDGTCRCGWARRPLLALNFEDASFSSRAKMRLAMKKWDMYHMYTPRHAIHFLIAWTPYAAFFTTFTYDRLTKKVYEETSFLPPSPEIKMMRDSTGGRTEYSSGEIIAAFDVEGQQRRLRVDFPGFAGGNLKAAIDLYFPPGYDSISSSQTTSPKRCHYGHKINCMTATGWMELNRETFNMAPEDSFGSLDFGRGH